MEIEERKGRPPGSVENSYTLVKRDLKETLGLAKRVRTLIHQQIGEFETALADKKLPLELRLDLTEKLGKLMQILAQSSRDMAKFIVEPGEQRKPEEGEVSWDQLLKGDD